MLNQNDLIELAAGDEVLHFLLIGNIEIKTAKNNRQFVSLELKDKTASLPAKMWDGFENFVRNATAGSIVKVAGVIEEFQNLPQIKIEKIRLATDNDDIQLEDFLPKSNRNLDTMISELNDTIGKISDPYLAKLLKTLFAQEQFEKYIRVPAGKAWHHAYLHGLLEHTLEIIKICNLMCDIYPEIKRDLLITGALLHDFGKTEELSYDNNFDYTDKGKLLGHIVIAAIEVEKTISQIDGFPNDLKEQLLHLILSHQGKLEFASPVEPKTLEAIVLYNADELSAKTNAYKNAILSEKNKGNKWTRFLPLANTSLFIPDFESTKDDNKKRG